MSNYISVHDLKPGMQIMVNGEVWEIKQVFSGEEKGFGPEKCVVYYTKPDDEKKIADQIKKEMQEKLDQETEADKAKRERVYDALKENRTTPRTKPDMASFCEMSVTEFNECVRLLKYEKRVKEESAEWCYGSEFYCDDDGNPLYVWKCYDEKRGKYL